MGTSRCLTALLALGLFAASAAAAPIAGFDIPQTGAGFTSIAPIGSPPGVAVSPLTMVGVNPNSFSNHFYAVNWGATVDLGKYYETTFTVAPNWQLLLTSLTFSLEDTNVGPTASTFEVRSSLDGFTNTIQSLTLPPGGDVTNVAWDLSSLGAFTGAMTLRFYGTTSSSGISLGFANHFLGGSGAGLPDIGQNIRFQGVLTPEPASVAVWSLLGLASVGYGWNRRRRGRRTPGR